MKLCSNLMGFFVFFTVSTFAVTSLCHSQSLVQDKNINAKATAERIQPVAKSDSVLVTFIEIGAARCIPCKAMQPIMKEIAEKYKGQVRVVFHDVWTPQGKIDGMKYNIRVIPTQVFLDKSGKEYFRHEGYFPKEELIKVLKMQGVK